MLVPAPTLVALPQDAATSIPPPSRYCSPPASNLRFRCGSRNGVAAQPCRMWRPATGHFSDANHAPKLILNRKPGTAPMIIAASPNHPVSLNASGSTDPDGNALSSRWWQYKEVSGVYALPAKLDQTSGPQTVVTAGAPINSSLIPPQTEYQAHIILEVADNGSQSLVSYRRADITVPRPQAAAEHLAACAAENMRLAGAAR